MVKARSIETNTVMATKFQFLVVAALAFPALAASDSQALPCKAAHIYQVRFDADFDGFDILIIVGFVVVVVVACCVFSALVRHLQKKPLTKNKGTMSQCTFRRDLTEPKFRELPEWSRERFKDE